MSHLLKYSWYCRWTDCQKTDKWSSRLSRHLMWPLATHLENGPPWSPDGRSSAIERTGMDHRGFRWRLNPVEKGDSARFAAWRHHRTGGGETAAQFPLAGGNSPGKRQKRQDDPVSDHYTRFCRKTKHKKSSPSGYLCLPIEYTDNPCQAECRPTWKSWRWFAVAGLRILQWYDPFTSAWPICYAFFDIAILLSSFQSDNFFNASSFICLIDFFFLALWSRCLISWSSHKA